MRELRGPLPHIPVVPTGGVSAENAPGFLEAGATAVAVGGWLTGSGDAEMVAKRARELALALAAWRTAVP